MKIDLRKLTGSNTVSIPFSETLDLREETLYGAKPFQSPVQISGEVSNESGVLRLKGTIKTIYSTDAEERSFFGYIAGVRDDSFGFIDQDRKSVV